MKIKRIKYYVIVVLAIIGLYTNVFYINPNILKVRQEVVKTSKMAENSSLTVVFFSDIKYSKSHSNDCFKDLAKTVNEFDPDIVIFGGDIFDFSEDNGIDIESQNLIIKELMNIEGELGKYAILGDEDHTNQETIRNMLTSANFEVLSNSSTTIFNGQQPLINLVAIEPTMYNNLDSNTLFDSLDKNLYTISICHTPDAFDQINQGDLMLSGHTLNMQLYIPLISQMFKIDGGIKYNRHQYHKDQIKLDITSGIGCKGENVRLFADPEIVVYQIYPETIKKELAD